MMSKWVFAAAVLVACIPQAPAPVRASAAPAKPSGCREENADCAAACALRETSRSPQFVEWFDQRCAAAVLGKNPDVVVGANPPPLKAELLDTR
ncbi:MAG TPA: hypothetical protein VGH87_23975 [Polyangiaceae bacterium]|jgi:hypothetical protein|nr:hypothetical protein [Polyangiaceae bacterium]